MKILGMKPGHDGSIAYIETDSQSLVWSLEAEKDSFPRYAEIHPDLLMLAAQQMAAAPDAIAIGGWWRGTHARTLMVGSGYFGAGAEVVKQHRVQMFGRPVTRITTSHERSHIWCSYAMSPFEQSQGCYVLVWEGSLGAFYFVSATQEVQKIGTVLEAPGYRYSLLYGLADPQAVMPKGMTRDADAGKLMALCAYGQSGDCTPAERQFIEKVLNPNSIPCKDDFRESHYYNIGLQHPDFTRVARRCSEQIFELFHRYAVAHLEKGYPLLISGGCGLNCDWNTHWKDCGHFTDVFVPPCTNDTGSAIGSAVEAMLSLTGKAKLEWDVYRDRDFVDDRPSMPDVEVTSLTLPAVVRLLQQGCVVAWAQGRCEIGPRALGHRSLLAAPFDVQTRDKLNKIKEREEFRPIAPICLEEDVSRHFDWSGPSPYMLFFQHVTDPRLRAVTHIDGTARVQTVNRSQNAALTDLLLAFRAETGVGVLCNTSLNLRGSGFISRTSDLYNYCKARQIEAFVHGEQLCIFRGKAVDPARH